MSGEDGSAHPDASTVRPAPPSPAQPEPVARRPPLRRIGERYAIEAEIGRGGMGIVYRAHDRTLDRQVAVKVLPCELAAGDETLDARFVSEAEATARLQHPGIVPIYDLGLDDAGRLLFAMKLVQGRTLAQVVQARDLSLFRLIEVFADVCRAVAFAHERGVLHRDLKPQNVMIGGHGEVHVMDWGLAKRVGARAPSTSTSTSTSTRGGAETEAGAILGTPAYMAPEQAEGDPARVGTRSDVYSLGATLYHLLTGRAPFDGRSTAEIVAKVLSQEPPRPRALDASVAREVEAICLRAMAKDPDARYASASALADDVQAFLEGRPVAAYPEGLLARVVKWGKRNKAITVPTSAAIVVGFVVAIALLVQARANLALATRNLGRAFLEKGERAADDRDWMAAEVFFARSLTLDDRRETRERLLEARTKGARLLWELPPLPEKHGAILGFDADGGRIGVLRHDGLTRVVDARTGAVVSSTEGGGPPIQRALSPDLRLIAETAQGESAIHIRDAGTGEELLRLATPGPVSPAAVLTPAFRPDGRRIAANDDRRLLVWDTAKGALLLRGEEGAGGLMNGVRLPAYDASGRRIATARDDGTVLVFDADSGARLLSVRIGDSIIYGVAFDPTDRWLAVCGRDKIAHVLEARTGRELRTLVGHSAAFAMMSFAPWGARLVTGYAGDGSFRVWDVPSGATALAVRRSSLSAVLSPDGRRIASWSGRTLSLFELDPPRDECVTIRGHEGQVADVAALAGGAARIATAGGAEGTVRVWGVEGPDAVARAPAAILRAPGAFLASIAATRDGRLVASGSLDRTVRVWDAATGAEVRTLRGHEDEVYGVAFSPDGRSLATASRDRTVRIWDLEAGAERRPPLPHPMHAWAVAWSPDGRRLATSDSDDPARVHVWDVEMGRSQAVEEGEGLARALAFTPDGRRLVTAGDDGFVRVRDAGTLAEALALPHGERVMSLALDADGRRVAAGGAEGLVRIRDLATGEEVFEVRGHDGDVNGLAFLDGPGGRQSRLASAGADGAVRIWDLGAVERFFAMPAAVLFEDAERATGLRLEGLDAVPVER